MIRRLGCVVGAVVCIAGCEQSARPPTQIAPPPLQPVLCAEYPSDRQDVVSCRSTSNAQANEVWARSTQLAAVSAIAQQFNYIQWLSVDTHVETATENIPVDCSVHGVGVIRCTGGDYQVPVGFVSITRFAFLNAEEARARSSDPLIPAERRPLDARAIVAPSRR